jgi:phosphoribosylformimino-5-aminoimidazole carboxamide ribotide isomerase
VLIIPAIDIKNGKCVRLFKGDFDKEKVYGNSPVSQAKEWEKHGGDIIHLVDLDGALEGKPVNLGLIKEIRKSVSTPVEIGGGVRTMEIIDEYVNAGIDRIIIGSKAYKDPEFVKEACKKYHGKIIVGIDMADKKVAIHGWKDVTDTDGILFAKQMQEYGVSELIITDIAKDGTLSGISPQFYAEILDNVSIPVIASGGIGSLDDIKALAPLSDKGLIGTIIGKALYENKITIKEAKDYLAGIK